MVKSNLGANAIASTAPHPALFSSWNGVGLRNRHPQFKGKKRESPRQAKRPRRGLIRLYLYFWNRWLRAPASRLAEDGSNPHASVGGPCATPRFS